MSLREETQALNSLTLQTIGNLLGLHLPSKGMARCPLPDHDDSKPSFEVRGGGRRWVCYRCDRRGGAIDLVMAIRGLRFPEAKRWLAENSGMMAPIRARGAALHGARAEPVGTLAGGSDAPETAADKELYAALLARAPLMSSGRNYLNGRSLADATIARFSIGQMPDLAAIRDLVGHFGFERIETAGLFTRKSTPEHYWPIFPPGSLLFPYVEARSIVYIQARLFDEGDHGSRWRNLNHRRRRLYNADVLALPVIRRVAICEGAIDVLSAAQLGFDAIGLIGVSARLTDTEIMALRGRQVDLLLDWDTAGEARAVTLRKELARFGVAATRKTRPSPSATDVNDFLREVSGPT